MCIAMYLVFFFSSRRRHTRFDCDWSSDVCSSDLLDVGAGRREGEQLQVHACAREHLFPIGDIPMRPHGDVVVPGIAQHGVSVVVGPDRDRARAGPERLEVLGGIEVVVEVDDLHASLSEEVRTAQSTYTGSPASTRSSPIALSRGWATIWLTATTAAAPAKTSGAAANPRARYAGV